MVIRRRGKSWQLDYGTIDGRRKMQSFKTEKAADDALSAALENKRTFGLYTPTFGELAELRLARQKLEGESLLAAVDFYRLHHAAQKRIMVAPLVESYLAAHTSWSRRTTQTRRGALKPLTLLHGTRWADELTRPDVERLMVASLAPKTLSCRLGHLRTLMKWAKARGHLSIDPTAGIEAPRAITAEIVSLSVPECRRLLDAAESSPEKWILPYVALGLLCGLRRAEIQRLPWEQIHLSEHHIIITAAQAKTRSRRIVDISSCAMAWLRLAVKKNTVKKVAPTGRILPGDFHHLYSEWKRRHRIDIPPNALRHSYATYHYAQHRNEALLQALMGHTSAVMLHRHYRGLRTRQEAAQFWAIRPRH